MKAEQNVQLVGGPVCGMKLPSSYRNSHQIEVPVVSSKIKSAIYLRSNENQFIFSFSMIVQ